MKHRHVLLSLICAIILLCSKQLQAGEVSPELNINVLTFSYVRGIPATVARAEIETSRIFRKIGVVLRWVDCLPGGAHVGNAACGLPPDPTTLTLHIHRWFSRTGGMTLADSDLGYAILAADRAGVAYEGVARMASSSADQAQVLGAVMAHEIGHLLLGSTQHAETGIMRAVWEVKDMDGIGRGNLRFTAPQADLIRANVLRRIMQRENKTEVNPRFRLKGGSWELCRKRLRAHELCQSAQC